MRPVLFHHRCTFCSAKSAVSERGALVTKAQTLAAALEAEQASRRELKERAQRKLAAAEAEVAALRSEAEAKARQLQARVRALLTGCWYTAA